MSTTPESELPDPNGAPVRSNRVKRLVGTAAGGSVLIAGTTAALFVATVTSVSTSGALRSQRIKWEDRRLEITEAQAGEAPLEQDTKVAEQGGQGDE